MPTVRSVDSWVRAEFSVYPERFRMSVRVLLMLAAVPTLIIYIS